VKRAKIKPAPAQRFAYPGLDRVIHERARLGLLTSLMTHRKGLTFNALKQLCGLTDGNLNRHLEVLERARLIEIKKDAKQGRPQTRCCITAEGRKRFLAYLAVLEQVLLDAESGTQTPNCLALARGLRST